MSSFAVIDTETNWERNVMSIGVVVADSEDFNIIDSRYYVIYPEASKRGQYADRIFKASHDIIRASRSGALSQLKIWIESNCVNDLFAYNAHFDKNLLPELNCYRWHDIMKIAAKKEHNPYIPDDSDCWKGGRLRSGYGVEAMLRILGEDDYCETHIAIMDAMDELRIMEILGHPIDYYPKVH